MNGDAQRPVGEQRGEALCYELAQAPDALSALAGRHIQGKLAIQVP